MLYWLFHDYAQVALIPSLISAALALFSLVIYLWTAGASIRTSTGRAFRQATFWRILALLAITIAIGGGFSLLLGSQFVIRADGPQQSDLAGALLGPRTVDQRKLLSGGIFLLLLLAATNGMLLWQTRRGSRLRLGLDGLRGIRRTQETHGSAHFATRQEYRRFQQTQDASVTLLGRFMGQRQGKRFTYLGDRFCLGAEDAARGIITIGNPGSGKSSSVILPVIYDSMKRGQNLVVADPQLELSKHILRYAAITGHRVILHDPSDTNAPRFNLAEGISGVNDARAIADVLIPKSGSGKDDFWSKSAEMLLAACLIRFDTIGAIFSSFNDIKALGGRLNEQPDDAQRLAAAFITSASSDGKLATNIVATLTTNLTAWADSAVRASTAASDFSAADLVDERHPTVLVLATPARYRRVIAPYLGAVLTRILLDLDTAGEQTESGALPVPVQFIIDEFPALGDLKAIIEYANLVRKRRISFLLALQTLGQLENIYGRNGTETLLAGMAFQIIFGGADQRTAEHYSRQSGRGTEIEAATRDGQPARSWGRELLTPDEIVRPPQGNATIFGRYVTAEYATYVIVLSRLTRIYERQDVKLAVKRVKRRPYLLPRGGVPAPQAARRTEARQPAAPPPATIVRQTTVQPLCTYEELMRKTK